MMVAPLLEFVQFFKITRCCHKTGLLIPKWGSRVVKGEVGGV